MITATIVTPIATAAALILAGIVAALRDNGSQSGEIERLTAPLPPTGPRHALGVATGSQAQVRRWGQDTETLPRITEEVA